MPSVMSVSKKAPNSSTRRIALSTYSCTGAGAGTPPGMLKGPYIIPKKRPNETRKRPTNTCAEQALAPPAPTGVLHGWFVTTYHFIITYFSLLSLLLLRMVLCRISFHICSPSVNEYRRRRRRATWRAWRLMRQIVTA